ncbi:hypothetical protein [Baekduia sp. Peel2402]|uniref:hypothetical protein n=1 Tax=Baekduia sp. Peel2402 TaxID=3458296 RepID=UPI00403EE67E
MIMLALLCAFSFGAIVRVATADPSYHTNCVGHGFLEGADYTDGSFFARVDDGCNSGYHECAIYSYGVWRGGTATGPAGICNAWSRNYGNYTECAGSAYTYASGLFSGHFHYAPNRCI